MKHVFTRTIKPEGVGLRKNLVITNLSNRNVEVYENIEQLTYRPDQCIVVQSGGQVILNVNIGEPIHLYFSMRKTEDSIDCQSYIKAALI